MHDFASFLQSCGSSGTLLASLCGLVVIPFAAWVVLTLATPLIRAMRNDVSWQAPLAAIAALLPGGIFLTLAVIGIVGASSSGCLQFSAGRIVFGAILTLTLIAIARATALAFQRSAQVRGLIVTSCPANEHLSSMGQSIGVEIRVVADATPLCALAGCSRPLILVSTNTLERLSDQELAAALWHERAHFLRRDVILAGTLSFFVDLLPLPNRQLVQAYSTARELAADQRAIVDADAHHLGSAILALAGSTRTRHSMASLAEDSKNVKDRLLALFERPEYSGTIYTRRIAATSTLLAITLLSFAPAIASAVNYHACMLKGVAS